MIKKPGDIVVLGIESSCDDTSCAIICNHTLLANIICSQTIHEEYGGVVPELASRSHLQNIVPTLSQTLKKSGVNLSEIDAIAYTRGPGLMGSLLVGSSFAKSLSLVLNIPLLEVNHMRAHILAHFIQTPDQLKKTPSFPFLCLTVSGGHTQLVLAKSFHEFELLGETIDDAAGEAFDKGAKILGLPYPGGPLIDQLAQKGNPEKFHFTRPRVPELNFSFSGLKTSLLYTVRELQKNNPDFIKNNLHDLCASYQQAIVDCLLEKLLSTAQKLEISTIAISGGVSANSRLRKCLQETATKNNWELFIPEFQFCTDNAAMIAIAGLQNYLSNKFSDLSAAPFARIGN